MALYPVEVSENIKQDEHSEEARTCWICFGTDEDNPTLPWVQPCKCRGSGKWVHQTCLLLWVDEKKKENRSAKISCPQCKVEYIIIFPKCDTLMSVIQGIDDLVYKVCPVIAAGVTVGIIFWAASSYGAFTVMQIFGEEDGLGMLERTDPLALLLFLPIIPAALIVMKLVRWEDYVLTFLRKGSKYPVLRHILPSFAYSEVMGQRVDIIPPPSDISSTRIFVGGLVLPTIAKIFGDVFFHTEQSCLKKCILGGLSFIAIKGALKMYYQQKTYIQQCQRRVLNHHEHNIYTPEILFPHKHSVSPPRMYYNSPSSSTTSTSSSPDTSSQGTSDGAPQQSSSSDSTLVHSFTTVSVHMSDNSS